MTHSAAGCLRVATSIGPDVVLLDPALRTARVEQLLRAHPVSARAQVLHLDAAALGSARKGAKVLSAA